MGGLKNFFDILKVDADEDYIDNDYYDDNEKEEKPAFAPQRPAVVENDNDDDSDRLVKRMNTRPQVSRPRKGQGNMEVVRVEPASVEDGRKISDLLLEGKVVFLDLEGIDMNLAQRIIDFVSGATYAIDGTLQQMSKYTFVIAPPAVNVSGDFQETASGNTSVTF